MRTSHPDIWAAGDAVEVEHTVLPGSWIIPLAGPANRQARVAAENICGRDTEYESTQGTSIVKVFDMVAGGTGATEKQLKAAGIPFLRAHAHPSGHAGYYPGTAQMDIKCLFSPDDGRVLGAQITGFDGVDKRLDVFATAIRLGATVYDLEKLELAYAPPFGSAKDPVNMIGFVASNILRGDLVPWYSTDYPENCQGARIIDVRGPSEFDIWHVPGAENVPLNTLREAQADWDRDDPDPAVLRGRVPQLPGLPDPGPARLHRREDARRRHPDLPRVAHRRPRGRPRPGGPGHLLRRGGVAARRRRAAGGAAGRHRRRGRPRLHRPGLPGADHGPAEEDGRAEPGRRGRRARLGHRVPPRRPGVGGQERPRGPRHQAGGPGRRRPDPQGRGGGRRRWRDHEPGRGPAEGQEVVRRVLRGLRQGPGRVHHRQRRGGHGRRGLDVLHVLGPERAAPPGRPRRGQVPDGQGVRDDDAGRARTR